MTSIDMAEPLNLGALVSDQPCARCLKQARDKRNDSPYSLARLGNREGGSVKGQPDQAETDPLEALLSASGHGDRAAFARVYELTSSRLYAIALRLLRRPELAEEVLQEAYVLIWRKASTYEAGRGRPLPWMAAIVRNRAIDQLRSIMRVPEDPVPWDEAVDDLAAPLAAGLKVSAADSLSVHACLGQLKEKQRIAILLAYYYGLTYDELSDRLSSPKGTVKSWVRRGLIQMKACLEA